MSRLWIVLLIVCSVAMIGSQAGTDMKKLCKEIRLQLLTCTMRRKRSPIMEVLNPPIHVQRDVTRRNEQLMSIREIIVSSRVPMYNIPYPPVSSYVGYETAPIVPPTETDVHGTPGRFEFLPEESHSHVGFDSDIDQVAQLIYEVFERMPRSMPDNERRQRIEYCCLKGDLVCKCIH